MPTALDAASSHFTPAARLAMPVNAWWSCDAPLTGGPSRHAGATELHVQSFSCLRRRRGGHSGMCECQRRRLPGQHGRIQPAAMRPEWRTARLRPRSCCCLAPQPLPGAVHAQQQSAVGGRRAELTGASGDPSQAFQVSPLFNTPRVHAAHLRITQQHTTLSMPSIGPGPVHSIPNAQRIRPLPGSPSLTRTPQAASRATWLASPMQMHSGTCSVQL